MEITRLFDFLTYQIQTKPIQNALVTKRNGVWNTISSIKYQELADRVSRGLLRKGVKIGDRVALINTNNISEWNIMDIALQQIGAISVPIYPTISPEEYEFIFNDAEIEYSFVSDEVLYNKMLETKSKSSYLKEIFTFEDVKGANNWKEILELGRNDSNQIEVEEIKSKITPDDIVSIIYTSGTTGSPKGVMITHNNLVSNVLACNKVVPYMGKYGRALSFLPICHVFERMLSYIYQYNSIAIYYAESIEAIGDNLKEVKPTIMTVVPRLVEKVYAKIYDKGSTAGGLKTKIFTWALDIAKSYEPFKEMSYFQKVQYQLADKLVFSKWRDGVGGNIVCMVSGSAKLNADLNRMFWAAGIPILEGYGLTETSPVISVNELKAEGLALGSVGKIVDNLDVKIADDGEILVKGPSVFKGYYKQPEKTKEVFTEDGYFMTGDIGNIKNGILYITDRKKQIFKTSGGKYIVPQTIENAMSQIPFIEQIMVVGEGQKMPTALIQPNFDFVREFIKKNNITIENPTDERIAKSAALKEIIEEQIKVINKQFGHWEQIKKFELTPERWTIENGLLTPTLKHKRKNIKNHFIDLYNKMYDIK